MLALPLGERKKRMQFRFSIRDLFWLTLVLALSIGWWLSNRQLQSKITQLQGAVPTVSIDDARVEKAMQMDKADLQ
jgi:hypothetical protein